MGRWEGPSPQGIGRQGGAAYEGREARPAEGRGVGMDGGGQDRAQDDEVEGEPGGLFDLCGVVARRGNESVASQRASLEREEVHARQVQPVRLRGEHLAEGAVQEQPE
jgi:hypothetical protein